MNKVPSLTARDVVRALKRAGFEEVRQKGSHLLLMHPVSRQRTVVPTHAGKTIKHSLLMGIIKESGLSKKKFFDLV
jgi:predicted RNA binding protein YcfA (HicA-like mRNA interferase family)